MAFLLSWATVKVTTIQLLLSATNWNLLNYLYNLIE